MQTDIERCLLAGEVNAAEQWELASAVKALADRICRADTLLAVNQVRLACEALNKARQFEHCRTLAQAWWDYAEQGDIAIVKHLVQAQINLSMLDQAAQALAAWENASFALLDSAVNRKEQIELDGLAARLLKQRFVNEKDASQLELAHEAYLKGHQAYGSKNFWFGVNVVALRARAEREGLDIGTDSSTALAAHMLPVLKAMDDENPWRFAALSELSMAVDSCEDAELWLYRLIHSPQCTLFMLDSYERQLREIWQGRALQGGARCADRLATILTRYQITRLPTWSMTPERARDLGDADLEKVFSDVRSFSVPMIRRMLEVCRSIGCVSNGEGARLGTGFVIHGEDIGSEAGEKLFVTNAHVLSDTVAGAIPIQQALVSFELCPDDDGKPNFYRVLGPPVYTSAPGPLGISHPVGDLLDVTVVRLEKLPESVVGLRVAAALPLIDGLAKAYVIGHPLGSGLQVSLHDSELLACDAHERLVHYRTPTDPGSSGSPVFNEDWQIIALHHGGSFQMPRLKPKEGTYQANEGITMSAIRTGYSAQKGAQPAIL